MKKVLLQIHKYDFSNVHRNFGINYNWQSNCFRLIKVSYINFKKYSDLFSIDEELEILISSKKVHFFDDGM